MNKLKNLLLASAVVGFSFGAPNTSYSQYFTPGKGSSVKQYKNSRGEVVVEQYNIDYLQGGSKSENNYSNFENTLLMTGAIIGGVYILSEISKPREVHYVEPSKPAIEEEEWWEEEWWKDYSKKWLDEQSREAGKYFSVGENRFEQIAGIISYKAGKKLPFGEKVMWFDKKLSELMEKRLGKEWWNN